jgi:hypothetical protein
MRPVFTTFAYSIQQDTMLTRFHVMVFKAHHNFNGGILLPIHRQLHRGASGVSLLLWLLLVALLLTACDQDAPDETTNEEAIALPTSVELVATPTTEAIAEVVQPTATTEPTIPPPPPTFTPLPTSTPLPPTNTPSPPTETPVPSETPTVPTMTPIPTATSVPVTQPPPAPTSPPAAPTLPADPVLGGSVLPNGSFEEGWYHTNGISELQTPNHWVFEWDEGPTGYGGQSWDVWVRPEMRVLSRAFLPPQEHELFIFDGEQTIKIFKGAGAISYRMYQDVALEPGTYIFEINLFADLYTDYGDNGKVWATDPFAGEIRFITPDGGTGWFPPAYGRRNTFTHAFTITETQTVRVGAGIRGRYAIANNGWFLDDWSLQKVQN